MKLTQAAKAILLLVLSLRLPVAGQAPLPILAPRAQLERVFAEGVFTEGVAVAPDGLVYFCDMSVQHGFNEQASHLYRFDPHTKQTVIYRSPSGFANGMKFNAAGEMVTVQGNDGGTRNVTRTDLHTGKSYVVADAFEGRPLNSPNDLVFDAQGRLYFTDPRNVGTEPIDQPIFGVYRVDRDGKLTDIISNLLAPNGIAVSPDQQTLYVSEHPYTSHNLLATVREFLPMSIKAYRLGADGSATLLKTLVDFGATEGADGLLVDSDGNLYAAVRAEARQGIRVYSPAGQELAYIATPEKPTNLAFGRGTDRHTLYITAGKGLYRIQTQRQGYVLPAR